MCWGWREEPMKSSSSMAATGCWWNLEEERTSLLSKVAIALCYWRLGWDCKLW
jgi:hypothetical protein